MLELYHYGDSLCSMKVRFCLFEKGVEFKSRYVDLLNWEHLTDKYKKLNPNAVVPTIVHHGNPIIESTIINEYIDEVFPGYSLTPQDPVLWAKMKVWTKLQDDVLHPAIQKPTFNILVKPLLAQKSDEELDEWLSSHPLEKSRQMFKGAARGKVNIEALEDAQAQFNFIFERMEDALKINEWLCGSQFTLADIAYAPAIDRLEQCDWSHLFENYPNVLKWCEKIRVRDAFSKMRPTENQRFSNVL
ncbi:MAG: hypothetical protein CMM67_10405 [Rhodospirillaceae bacterium]|nr:hypothetical protein [Rhodospirillaceae bacterium]OUT76484.1 MAG: hypothetical protein CBB83_10585 [Rhodospirillaceae bacterium TMED23]|tara:strand:+ start:4668 stop:5402 length:735 start_codon:yes stop_codon:yes gene_type:complete